MTEQVRPDLHAVEVPLVALRPDADQRHRIREQQEAGPEPGTRGAYYNVWATSHWKCITNGPIRRGLSASYPRKSDQARVRPTAGLLHYYL